MGKAKKDEELVDQGQDPQPVEAIAPVQDDEASETDPLDPPVDADDAGGE